MAEFQPAAKIPALSGGSCHHAHGKPSIMPDLIVYLDVAAADAEELQ